VDKVLSAIIPNSNRSLDDRLLAYEIVARAIRPVLDRGLSAIPDCTFSRKVVREQVLAHIRTEDHLVVIELRVSPQVALARYYQRGEHRAIDLTAEIVDAGARNYPYGSATATLSGEAEPDRLRDEVLNVINHGPDLDRNRWVYSGRSPE
jgi:hypothetical protein